MLITGYDGVYCFTVPQTDYPEEVDYFPITGASLLEFYVECTEDAFIRSVNAIGDQWDWAIGDLENTTVIVNVKVV